MNAPTLPVDIYIRVSRVGKRETMRTPDDQEAVCRAYAQSRGYTVGKVIAPDVNVSGTKRAADRAGLTEAIARVEAGISGGVVGMDVARVARSVEFGRELIRVVEQHGGVVDWPGAPMDTTTPMGKKMVTDQLSMAEYYSDEARYRGALAREGAIAAGVPVLKHVPLGYTTAGRAGKVMGKLAIDPKTAPVIRRAFALRADGASLKAVGEHLKAAGVLPPPHYKWHEDGTRYIVQSPAWSLQSVKNLLARPVYRGVISSGTFKNDWDTPPLVTDELWHAAQRSGAAPVRGTASPLGKIVFCAACDRALQRTSTGRGTMRYRCPTGSASVCPGPRAGHEASALEAAVLAAFWYTVDAIEATVTNGGEAPFDLGELISAAQVADSRLAAWMETDVDIEPAAWEQRRAVLARRSDEATTALRSARQSQPAAVVTRTSLDDVADADLRQLVAATLGRVLVHREVDAAGRPLTRVEVLGGGERWGVGGVLVDVGTDPAAQGRLAAAFARLVA